MAGSKVRGADPHRHGSRDASGRFVRQGPPAPPAAAAGTEAGDPVGGSPKPPAPPPNTPPPPPSGSRGSLLARVWRGSLGDLGR